MGLIEKETLDFIICHGYLKDAHPRVSLPEHVIGYY